MGEGMRNINKHELGDVLLCMFRTSAPLVPTWLAKVTIFSLLVHLLSYEQTLYSRLSFYFFVKYYKRFVKELVSSTYIIVSYAFVCTAENCSSI